MRLPRNRGRLVELVASVVRLHLVLGNYFNSAAAQNLRDQYFFPVVAIFLHLVASTVAISQKSLFIHDIR